MKHLRFQLPVFVSAALLTLASCGSKSDKPAETTRAARQHAAMRASLRDSAALYASRLSQIQALIDARQPKLDSLLSLFEMDVRPEYVEHYRVARGWRGYDTMASTGILARITEDGTPELIASSASGKFNSLELTDGSQSVALAPVTSSDLNYTVGGMTRVAFMGDEVLELCRFAAVNEGKPLKVVYKGGVGGTLTLSASQKSMLALIARTFDTQKEIESLNRQFTVAFNKQQLYEGEVRKDSLEASKKK